MEEKFVAHKIEILKHIANNAEPGEASEKVEDLLTKYWIE